MNFRLILLKVPLTKRMLEVYIGLEQKQGLRH